MMEAGRGVGSDTSWMKSEAAVQRCTREEEGDTEVACMASMCMGAKAAATQSSTASMAVARTGSECCR